MRRKPLTLILVAVVLVSVLIVGCGRRAVPPVDTLEPEGEGTASSQEAEGTTPGSTSPVPTPTGGPDPTTQPTTAPGQTAQPTEPSQPANPTATSEPSPTQPSPTGTTAPTAVSPTTTPGQPGTHVVQRGENLFRIALRYNTTVPVLAQANNITNPGLIYVGQKLTIPSGGGTTPPPPGKQCSVVYTVKSGDNLFRIALRYNYSQYYLAQVNNISNPALIRVGQQICIP